MQPKKVLVAWAEKFIYGWLIFCVGGLAPLTFNTPLSPHRDIPTVYIALFDSPPHFSFTSAGAASVRQVWRSQHFTSNSTGHTLDSFIPSLVQFFQSNLSHGYLLTLAHAPLIFHTSLGGLIALYMLSGRSALLPPLEKPPQLRLA